MSEKLALPTGSKSDAERGIISAPTDVAGSRRSKQALGAQILLGLLAAGALAHQAYHAFPSHAATSKGHIDWQPCWEDKTVLCGTFEVPTDYTNSSVGSTYLAVTKIPASVPKKDRLGSIFVNYGGPGVPGRTASFSFGRILFETIGERYDLISWDQRGLGRTVPAVKCHATPTAAAVYKANTVMESTFEVPPCPNCYEGRAVLIAQQKQALAIMQGQAEICDKAMGADVLKYMGTTMLIKDMERLSAALEGEDAPINFIGGSYGTVVAEYLVNMLPNKIGRVVAHGVADPTEWAGEHYENYKLLGHLLADAEIAYERFQHECHVAGPDECALSRAEDSSGKDIGKRVGKFIEDLYDQPMPVEAGGRNAVLKSGIVRSTIFEVLQFPGAWQKYAARLDSAMRGNGTALVQMSAPAIPYHPKPDPDGFVSVNQGDLGRLAVSCADAPPYLPGEPFPSAEAMVDDLEKVVRKVSKTFGATVNLMEQHGGCQFWPKSDKPVERFNGPWNSTLANPILILSNSHDPITPAISGREFAERYSGQSRHVVQNATGHSYLVPFNKCFKAIVQDYYNKGKLPKDFETFCNDEPASNFPPDGVDQRIKDAWEVVREY